MQGVASASVHMATLSERLAADPMEASQEDGGTARRGNGCRFLAFLVCAFCRHAGRLTRAAALRAAQTRSQTAWPSAHCRRR
jgi:hypothetical protein